MSCSVTVNMTVRRISAPSCGPVPSSLRTAAVSTVSSNAARFGCRAMLGLLSRVKDTEIPRTKIVVIATWCKINTSLISLAFRFYLCLVSIKNNCAIKWRKTYGGKKCGFTFPVIFSFTVSKVDKLAAWCTNCFTCFIFASGLYSSFDPPPRGNVSKKGL